MNFKMTVVMLGLFIGIGKYCLAEDEKGDKVWHVLMVEACMLPKTFEHFKGKKFSFELITSGKAFFKLGFDPEICLSTYRDILGKDGEIVDFKTYFVGEKLSELKYVTKKAQRIQEKRGKIDFVLTLNSDLATYIGDPIRKALGLPQAKWDIELPGAFYDKLIMKKTLVSKTDQVKTAPFISYNESRDKLRSFFKEVGFPQNPILVKKIRSAGAVGVEVIESYKKLDYYDKKIKNKENYLLEKFITGKTFRINGEVLDGKANIHVSSYNRTSPLEHYRNGKVRIITTIDEDEIPKERIHKFTMNTLKALGMKTGTYHLEGIHSDVDGELYFMEIAARPGEGNLDDSFIDLYHYNAKKSYYYWQIPVEFFGKERDQQILHEIMMDPTTEVDDAFAVINYPFLDAGSYTYQKVKTNLICSRDSKRDEKLYPTFVDLTYDKVFSNLNDQRMSKLRTRGKSVARYAYQSCLRAFSARFIGPRDQVEKDLKLFEKNHYFNARTSKKIRNALFPRKLLKVGGL